MRIKDECCEVEKFMKKIKRNGFRKAGVGLGMFAMFVFVLLMVANTGNVVVKDNIEVAYETRIGGFKQVRLLFLGDNDPGSGASGVMYSWVNLTGDGYADNVSGGWTSDDNNSHVSSDISYESGLDAGFLVRWNKTHAWDSAWNLSLVRVYANCSVLSVSGVQMVEVQVATSADYLYVNYFLRDSDGGAGSGFTISRGQNVTSYAGNFESYYS